MGELLDPTTNIQTSIRPKEGTNYGHIHMVEAISLDGSACALEWSRAFPNPIPVQKAHKM